MKRMYAGLLAAAILTGCTASVNDEVQTSASEQTSEITTESAASQTEETTSAAIEATSAESSASQTEETTSAAIEGTSAESSSAQTEETAEDKTEFTSDTAENYYNIIMGSTDLWRKDSTIAASMIDLQGDGNPEFIVSDGERSAVDRYSFDCYEFEGDTLGKLYSFKWGGYAMPKYIEDGKTYWFGSISEYEREETDDSDISPSYKSNTELGLFDFTEEPEMVKVLFSSSEEYDRETDIYKGEMYIGGEHYGDDYIENYSQLDGAPDLLYYSWYTDKAAWEGENLTNDENYTLCPNEVYWNADTDISADIVRLVNAYCDNDKSYLTRDGYFGEVNAFKPVIYLYPEETMDISVNLKLDGRLLCSYPDYGSGWRVNAKPDGTLYDKRDGSEYSYLFWEAALNAEWDMSKGFVVKGGDTEAFLREKLAFMGLTPREYNEFIVYWLPLMKNNRYNLISFQTDAYEDAAQLEISPAPDSILRVFMVFKSLDEYEEIPPQELTSFERNGFTVVEWGGTLYNS